MRLVEQTQIVLADEGEYVSLKDYNHIAIVVLRTGAPGADPVVTVEQATNVAGDGVKPLTFTTAYIKAGEDVGTFTKVTKTDQPPTNTFTQADSGDADAIIVIEIDAPELDVEGGYDCVHATSTAGTVIYLLGEPRYAGDPLPSALVD